MPTVEERLEELERALSTLQGERISDVRQLHELIDALRRQLTEQGNRIAEQEDSIAEQENNLLGGFDDLAKYQIRTEQKIDERFDRVDVQFAEVNARFDRVDARFAEVNAQFNRVDARFAEVDTRLDKIEATMATKEDLASLELRMQGNLHAIQGNLHAMEGRMLDAFKQVLVMIDSRLPPSAT